MKYVGNTSLTQLPRFTQGAGEKDLTVVNLVVRKVGELG